MIAADLLQAERPQPESLECGERARILLVDDDPALRALIRDFLGSHGFTILEADGATGMRAMLDQEMVDLVVLDVMMPGEDGLSLARSLSALGSVGIIIVSALGSETDRIIGLEVGADDYLAKPVSPRELLARIRAVLRRQRSPAEESGCSGCFLFDDWQFDVARRVLKDPEGIIIALSDGEFSLLRAFVEHPQRVLTRDQLLDYARGPDSDAFDRAIDTQVSRLRRKLSSRIAGEFVRTVRNEGYMFVPRVSRRR